MLWPNQTERCSQRRTCAGAADQCRCCRLYTSECRPACTTHLCTCILINETLALHPWTLCGRADATQMVGSDGTHLQPSLARYRQDTHRHLFVKPYWAPHVLKPASKGRQLQHCGSYRTFDPTRTELVGHCVSVSNSRDQCSTASTKHVSRGRTPTLLLQGRQTQSQMAIGHTHSVSAAQ